MILYFDTNVMLDVIVTREPFATTSLVALNVAVVEKHKCFLARVQ